MTATETVQHMKDMGVLDKVVRTNSGRIIAILASSWGAYGERCMRDFHALRGYYVGSKGIDGVTTDGVPVIMTFKGAGLITERIANEVPVVHRRNGMVRQR